MDFSKATGASFRAVGEGQRDGKPTRIARASRSYPTSQQDLWNALTEKTRVCRWFADVSGDFKLGGRYAIKGNANGTVTECEPPKSLALTWEYNGNVSWVSAIVETTDDGAVLTLEHEMPTDPASEAHWAKYGPGATGVGWEMAFVILDVHLSDDGQFLIEAGEAWAAGEPGKATLRIWAEAWGQAHIESGESAETANDMAQKTAGFYTGSG